MIVDERLKLVGFVYSGEVSDMEDGTEVLENARVLEVGRVKYEFIERRDEIQLIDGEYDDDLRWIDLFIDLHVNYTGSQKNKGSGYTYDGNPAAAISKSNTDFVELANRIINTNDVYFLPLLQTGDNTLTFVDSYYQVVSRMTGTALINATRAGFYDPAVPLKLKLKTPLSEYPDWISRSV